MRSITVVLQVPDDQRLPPITIGEAVHGCKVTGFDSRDCLDVIERIDETLEKLSSCNSVTIREKLGQIIKGHGYVWSEGGQNERA